MSMFACQIGGPNAAQGIYLGSEASIPVPSKGLPEEDRDWFIRARQETEALLERLPKAATALDPVPDSVSHAFLTWARSSDQEVALELYPGHEEAPRKSLSLSDVFADGRWLLERRGSVLTGMDALHFLRSPWGQPVSRLVDLVNASEGKVWGDDYVGFAEGQEGKAPNWSALAKFYQPVFSADDRSEPRQLISLGGLSYHGVRVGGLIDYQGPSYLYWLLPPSTKRRILSSPQGNSFISTRDLTPQARTRFYRYVHATYPQDEPPLSVCIRWSPGPSPGTRVVSLWLNTRSDEGDPDDATAGKHYRWIFIDKP
jgi:hypothetical protein